MSDEKNQSTHYLSVEDDIITQMYKRKHEAGKELTSRIEGMLSAPDGFATRHEVAELFKLYIEASR